MATNLSGYLGAFMAASAHARQRTQERLDQALGLVDQNIAMYQPGGDFGKGFEASLGQAKSQSIGQGMQHLSQAGLFNTSAGAGLGTAFEKTVGTPARLQLNDMRISKLADARNAKVNLYGSVNDRGPDPSLLANLMMQSANQPQMSNVQQAYSPHPWEKSYMDGSMGITPQIASMPRPSVQPTAAPSVQPTAAPYVQPTAAPQPVPGQAKKKPAFRRYAGTIFSKPFGY